MRDRLDFLLARLEDDSLSAAEADELAELLESRPEFRKLAVGQFVLASQLSDLLGESAQPALPDGSSDLSKPAAGQARFAWRAKVATAAIVLSVVAACCLTWIQFRALPRHDVAASNAVPAGDEANAQGTVVALLTRVTDGRWSDGKLAPATERLVLGQELNLAAGRVELRFLSGAQLNLQGPARLELESENGAILHHGTATAHVPPQAIGFTLWSPAMAVVDLGTEFGLRVREEGTTDVQVFEGAVEAEWAPAKSRESRMLLISTEEAARLNRVSGEMSRLQPHEVAIPRTAFADPGGEVAAAGAAKRGAIVADFNGQASEPSDQYPGHSGLGWVTPWNPLSSSKVKSERTLADEHPLLNGGQYLRLAHHSSLEGIGTQTRVYERRQYASHEQIALDRPHTISWLWRLDAMAGFSNARGDYFKCFDSTRFDTVANDDETTWAVIIHPHTTIKLVHVGEKPVRAPLSVVIGHVYEFTIEVDPQHNQYQCLIRQFDPAVEDRPVQEYRSPTLEFRNATKKNPRRVGGYLHFGPGLDHSDNDATEPELGTQVAYSLDRIRIAPIQGGQK